MSKVKQTPKPGRVNSKRVSPAAQLKVSEAKVVSIQKQLNVTNELNDELINIINTIVNILPDEKRGWFWWARKGWAIAKLIIATIKEYKENKEDEGTEPSQRIARAIRVK